MKRALTLILLALCACSPAQTQAWLDWFEAEPRAATDWALEECGALCSDDWDRDGVVEPEPSAEADESNSLEATSADTSTGFTDVTDSEHDSGVGVYWPWTALAECESNGNWHIATGNGYFGGLQFALGSWQSVGGQGYPHEASPAEQVRRAELLQDRQGWEAWPTCARIIGLL